MPFSTNVLSLFVNIQTIHQDTTSLLLFVFYMTFSLFMGFIMARKQIGEGRSKAFYLLIPISVTAMGLMICLKGISMSALKGYLLFLILYLASISDIRTREVPDHYSGMILLISLIQTEVSELPAMLFALVIVGLPQLIIASLKPGSHGGADIKLTSASAFLLGVWKGLFAIIVGLLAAILIPTLIRLCKKQSLKEGIPMIPYLSFGIALAFIF